jgi:hypothetical protein
LSARVDYAPAGREAEAPELGDLILTHNPYWTSRIIRLGQRLRYDEAHAFYNHVAVVYDSQGSIVEALGGGVKKRHISVYEDTPYYVVRIGAGSGDRRQVVNFLDAVLEARWRYGFLTIASVALTLLSGYSVVFARSGTAICSGLAAEALTRCGEIFDKPPAFVIPADLARHFGVPLGEHRG